jgi:hypothetical protein
MKRDTKQRLLEVMQRVDPSFRNEGVNFNMLFPVNEYRKKVNEIKAVIDKLLLDEDDDAIDTLYRLLVRRTKPNGTLREELTEIFDAIGRNENVEENQQLLNERLTTFASDIHSEISKLPGLKRLNLWSLANGFVGLYRYEKDGNAYEIEIRPVQVGTQKALWGNQIKKREDRNAG